MSSFDFGLYGAACRWDSEIMGATPSTRQVEVPVNPKHYENEPITAHSLFPAGVLQLVFQPFISSVNHQFVNEKHRTFSVCPGHGFCNTGVNL